MSGREAPTHEGGTRQGAAGEGETTRGPAGGHGRRLVAGTLLQQVAQATGLAVLLVVVTVLARRLSLPELGVYGLVATLSGSLLVLRNSVASSAVRAMAAADERERGAVFSAAAALYAIVGALTGALIAAAGQAIALGVLSGDLRREAQLGAVALGGGMAVGLAASVYLDALRASLLFTRAAAVEIGSLLLYLAGMLALIAAGAPLWLLIGASAAIPLASGIGCALIVRARRLPYRFQRAAVTRERVTRLLPTAGYLLVIELSSLLISGLDRIIVGAFRTPAAVGLYEGPIRAHNLFWSLNGALAVTVLPATSRYAGEGDRARVRALAVRGSRYTLALLVPLAVTLMALAAPILEVWLGAGFRGGATALTILVSYWLLYGAVLVTPGFLVGVGRERAVAGYMSAIALVNLALSLALTPLVGLEGPALGTAIPYVVAFPFVLRVALSAAGVPLGQLARQAWLPAYSLGACLAAGLVGLRLAVPLDTLPALLLAAVAGLALYWAAFFALWLRRDERALMLSLVRGAAPRRAAA